MSGPGRAPKRQVLLLHPDHELDARQDGHRRRRLRQPDRSLRGCPGHPLVTENCGDIDPTVYIDDDGQAYLLGQSDALLREAQRGHDLLPGRPGARGIPSATDGDSPDDSPSTSAGTPEKAYSNYIDAFNTANVDKVTSTRTYPHILVLGSAIIVAESEDEDLVTFPGGGWDHSVVNELDVVGSSERVAHLDVKFSRVDDADEVLEIGRATYGAHLVENDWKMKFICTLSGEEEPLDGDIEGQVLPLTPADGHLLMTFDVHWGMTGFVHATMPIAA